MATNIMLELEKQENDSECPSAPLEDGQTADKSKVSDCHPGSGSSTSQVSSIVTKPQKKRRQPPSAAPFSTHECPVTSNETTSKDKKITCKKTITKKKAKVSTFTILHPDSISRERALSRFWNPSKMEQYKELSWLPKIAWQGLDSNSLNGYVVNTERKSWFSITTVTHQPKNLVKTSSPSFKFTVVNGMGAGDTRLPLKSKTIKKSWKLRLFPTGKQKQILERWAGSSRYTYNKVVESLNNKKDKCRGWMRLRNRFVTATSRTLNKKTKKMKKNSFFNNKKWLLETPKSIRLSSVQEAISNQKACFTNLKRSHIQKFFLRYKSKKKERRSGWCLGFEKNNVYKDGDALSIFPRLLGDIKYARRKQLHKLIPGCKPANDCRIQKDAFGEYFLIVVVDVKTKAQQKHHETAKSYDPGVNIFATGYDPLGQATIIGKGCNDTLLTMLETLDTLYSQKAVETNQGVIKTIDQKILRQRKRIYYYKKELHHQVNSFIAKSSTLVLYPKLDTQKLTLKERRVLRTKTVRQMLNLGHCTAYEQLKQKCLEHGTVLLTVSEAYTTKTCPCCGELSVCNNNRVYNCVCGYTAERDLNGAQNILLRSVS